MRCGWQARREKRDRQMMMGALGTFGTVVRDPLLSSVQQICCATWRHERVWAGDLRGGEAAAVPRPLHLRLLPEAILLTPDRKRHEQAR